MGKVNLRVVRKKAVCAWIMNYRIIIDGKEIGQIKNGETQVYNVDDSHEFTFLVSVVGNSMTPHRIENFIRIDPKQTTTGEITIEIDTNLTILGFISGGWLKEMGQITFNLMYSTNFCSSNYSSGYSHTHQKPSHSNQTGTEQKPGGFIINFGNKKPKNYVDSHQNISTQSTPKFCSQCGAPLNPGSKFCSACGSKI